MKKIAPIFITLIIILYLSAVFILPMLTVNNLVFGGHTIELLLLATGVAFILTMLYVLYERLREIDKEKDDDLSKY